MPDADAGVHALLLGRLERRQRRAGAAAFVAERRDRRDSRPAACLCQRMVGGDRQEGGAEQRVRPRRVNRHFGCVASPVPLRDDFPADRQAFGTADPVLLHQPDLFRPLVERIERIKQILAEIGDAEEPLRQFALFHQGARAPAATVDHLLVGENGIVDRIPVDLRLLAVDETLFQEIQEEMLLALVVIDVAGGEFTRPIERQAHDLQLRLHRGDVLIGPGGRMHAAFHRCVFRRHAEGVPAHRMQHIVATGALVAGDDIAHRIVADMAHVDAARRIGKHLEHVVFFARIVVVGGRRRSSRSHSCCQRGSASRGL